MADHICGYGENAQRLYGLTEARFRHDKERVEAKFHPDDVWNGGGLALCGRRRRSVLAPGGWLVDERSDDGAARHRRPGDGNLATGKPDALLHHSDRGSQYTSEQFQRLMADHGVVCSMSRSGNVWDNAAMESFFSSLKTERTARKIYRTRNEAKADVFDYIERFYNPKRRHSTIGYLSPMEFEQRAGLV